MTTERIIVIIAGFFIMLSLSLGVEGSPLFMHKYWLFFTAFVGFNLFQSGFTGFCPLAIVLKAMGFKSSAECCGAK